jgi:hypothetical protein
VISSAWSRPGPAIVAVEGPFAAAVAAAAAP